MTNREAAATHVSNSELASVIEKTDWGYQSIGNRELLIGAISRLRLSQSAFHRGAEATAEAAAKAASEAVYAMTGDAEIADCASSAIRALPLPEAPPSRDDPVMRCTICGFVIDSRYEATKPTVDFTTAGRGKRSFRDDAMAAEEAIAVAKAALEEINHKRSICRGADHFECAVQFGECLDIAESALARLDALVKGGA